MAWLGTNSGRVIDLENPDPREITIEDIALGLSRVSRFNGQINRTYSVAQHSMWVASLVPERYKLQALLHDATEAFICDVPTPLKRMLGQTYKDVELRLATAIGQRFDVTLEVLSDEVKAADRVMLMTEHAALQSVPVDWGPEYDGIKTIKREEFLTDPITECDQEGSYNSFLGAFYVLAAIREQA